MRKRSILWLAVMLMPLAGISAQESEKTVKMADLPPAVQKAVKEHSKGATLKNLSTEVEKGKTQYEAEMTVNGHSKDVLFDANGNVLEVEEEVAMDSIPAPAKAAILKSAGDGKVNKVESVTKGGKLVYYEAKVLKGGKKSEITVAPDGKPVKD